MQYRLPDPLRLLSETAWPKSKWQLLVKTRVTVFFENKLRGIAQSNSKMTYLNVQISGLSGAPHTALLNINTSQDALRLRFHLKFLTEDYLTAERLAINHGTNPSCKLCEGKLESIAHILTQCSATADIHQRLLPELLNVVSQVQPSSAILTNQSQYLTQFILDCSSLNLPQTYRVPTHNPGISQVYKISRDWCYAVARERARLLKARK